MGRVADFDIAAVRWKANESTERIVFPIGTHVLDIHLRSNAVLSQTAGVDHLQNRIICEPQTSVGGFSKQPVGLKGTGPRHSSVEKVESLEFDRTIWLLPPLSEF